MSEVFNTQLISQYSALDERLVKIIIYLKHLNSAYKLLPGMKRVLNNYSLCLMVIAFFQRKKLLPNLQVFNLRLPEVSIQQIHDQNKQKQYKYPINTQFLHAADFLHGDWFTTKFPIQPELSVGQLFIDFLDFFADYNNPYKYKNGNGEAFGYQAQAIDISQMCYVHDKDFEQLDPFAGESFPRIFDVKERIEEDLSSLSLLSLISDQATSNNHKHIQAIRNKENQGELREFVRSNLLTNDFTYLIVDPFNRTYTPSKNVLISN